MKKNELEQELASMKDKYLRLMAEYDNYRKRTTKEKEDLMKYQDASLLKDLIPFFEDIRRLSDVGCDSECVGILKRKITKILDSHQIAIVKPEKYSSAENCDAMFSKNTDDPTIDKTVESVFECGYQLKDKMVVYPKVMVYRYKKDE